MKAETDNKIQAVTASAAAFSEKAKAILEMAKTKKIAVTEEGARVREPGPPAKTVTPKRQVITN